MLEASITRMRFLFIILFLTLSIVKSWATHIVGGDFYYKHLGGDNYRVTMKLYIDCHNGSDRAIESDKTAIITIFGANNNERVRTLEIERTGPIHLFGVAYKCVNNPGNVCVDQYTYIFETSLPKRKDGYIISFERCCRNVTIKNIVQPDATGATYWVHVPDRNVVDSDNSPVFKKFPPIYICKDFPLVFDHSATDADGDSLSYELYQPFIGADTENSSPGKPYGNPSRINLPVPPPFKNIYWVSGYSTGNQMRGFQILQIDELTGELTVTPDDVGQYVCGVKVKEWRKINNTWVLIGETLRDYQFNVLECDAVAVANFKPKIWCSDTVTFTDKSIGAKSVSWDFGDPNSGFGNNTSNENNPIHVYSKGGDYIVKQTAWNTACNDDYSLKIKVRIKKGFSLGNDKVHCSPFKHTLSVPWTDYNSIIWSTGAKTSYIIADKPGQYWVEATYGSCVLRDTINIGYDPISFSPLKDSLFCDNILMDLEIKNRSPKAKILWNIGDTSAMITANKEGKYIARIYNNNCYKYDTSNLVLAKITPKLGPDLFICNEFSIPLDAGLLQTGSHIWWNIGSNERIIYVNQPGKYWVTTRLAHCTKSDTINITNSKVILNIGPDKHFCDSVRMHLDAGAPNAGTITTYSWSNGETTQHAFIKTPGKHWVTKIDNFGCTKSDTILLFMTLSPSINIGKDTTICLRSPIPLTPGGGFNSYLWENGLTDVIRYVEEAGTFYVTVTDEAGCSGTDTIVVKTDPNKLPNEIYIPNAFSPNGDGLNDVFPFEMPVVYNDYNLKVFNRWGEKLYDSGTNSKPWNGVTLENQDQLDAYVWVATYKGCDGVRRTSKGTITILR